MAEIPTFLSRPAKVIGAAALVAELALSGGCTTPNGEATTTPPTADITKIPTPIPTHTPTSTPIPTLDLQDNTIVSTYADVVPTGINANGEDFFLYSDVGETRYPQTVYEVVSHRGFDPDTGLAESIEHFSPTTFLTTTQRTEYVRKDGKTVAVESLHALTYKDTGPGYPLITEMDTKGNSDPNYFVGTIFTKSDPAGLNTSFKVTSARLINVTAKTNNSLRPADHLFPLTEFQMLFDVGGEAWHACDDEFDIYDQPIRYLVLFMEPIEPGLEPTPTPLPK